MSEYVRDCCDLVADALAHVGLWLPLTVIFCTLAVAFMRRSTT